MSRTKKDEIVVRFAHVAAQPSDNTETGIETPISRLIGFVPAKYMLPLFDQVGLTANPRSSKRNSVVDDILITLQETPDLFRYKSKGILLGTSHYERLQRNRFRLRFEDPDIEGILDGGHNMLAVGLHMLRPLLDEREWKKLKSWDDMKFAWEEYRKEIEEEKDEHDFYVPVELLVPSGDSKDDIDAFLMSLLEVCEARNNNAQLPIEAKSNKQGFYDSIKEVMPAKISNKVEWKPNSWEDDDEKKPIKVRDLISLAWIPLNVLNESGALPDGLEISLSPQNTYRNKGECSKKFEQLMSHNGITDPEQGARRGLKHAGVRSAFRILADLPELYDEIYRRFPGAYNKGNRRFASNPIVKIYDPERRRSAKESGKDVKNYVTTQPSTPFYRKNVKNSYPEGLIYPVIYGLKGLMTVKDGEVIWATPDPFEFIDKHLPRIAEGYQLVMSMARWDPQKISKDPSSYEFAAREFRAALLEEERG